MRDRPGGTWGQPGVIDQFVSRVWSTENIDGLRGAALRTIDQHRPPPASRVAVTRCRSSGMLTEEQERKEEDEDAPVATGLLISIMLSRERVF